MALCVSKPGSELSPGAHSGVRPVLDTELCSSEECLSRFFFKQGLGVSEGLMEWTQQHTNRAAQTWEWSWYLLASLDRMILAWPAIDHGKISRVPIHTLKTRSDCPFKGVEKIFFFQIVLFFFLCEGGSYYEHS